jgi:predicted Zn-dependent peptidase
MADVRSVAVAYWVGAGSRDEPDELAGASHFLEHLLFKGTESRSAVSIAESLDEVGGDSNAFTTKEYTTFYVRLLAEHLPLGLDILSEIMWEPALRPVDVDAERTVILDEILMHADEPLDLASEEWQESMFPSHELGRDTLGTASTVANLNAADPRGRRRRLGATFHRATRWRGAGQGGPGRRDPPAPCGASTDRTSPCDLRHALGLAS